jgi:hypothetical protein
MTGPDSDRDQEPVNYYVEAAKARASENGIGVGVAVVESEYKDGGRVWECVAADGNEWHYLQVIGTDLGSFEDLEPEVIERGVERLAAGEPEDYRLGAVLNASPLHINKQGVVTD